MLKTLSSLLFLFLLSGPIQGQDLSETLGEVGEAYARVYIAPLAEALGADLNSGLFHTASTGKKTSGVHVYFGFKASATLLTSSDKVFDLTYTARVPIDVEIGGETVRFDVPATFTLTDAPTVFGEEVEPEALVRINHDTTYQTLGLTLPISIDSTFTSNETLEGFLPTDVAPFAVPQLGIGTLLGTDIMVRWLPQITVSDVGSIEILGAGIRHNLNQYLPRLPLDLSIQAVWQRVSADDDADNQVVDAHVFAVNMAASKQFGVLTVYGGIQTERSDIRVRYTIEPDEFDIDEEPVDIDFTLSFAGRTRGIFGAGVSLGPVLINTDISLGKTIVPSAGIGLSF